MIAKRLVCNGHAPGYASCLPGAGFMAELPIAQISLLGFLHVRVRYK
jgi:hypothetical protein